MSIPRSVLTALLAACIAAPAVSSSLSVGPWLAPGPKRNNGSAAEPSNAFGTKVFDRLLGPGADATAVISPYSLGSALDMLTLGADGATARLLRVSRGEDGKPLNESKAKLNKLLAGASTDAITLRINNSVWLKPDAIARPAFVDSVRNVYDASVTNIDFARPATVDTINQWVMKNTQDMIPRIVDRLDAQTEFLLINTTYFKGKWAVPFDEHRTKPELFTRADGSTHAVPMMQASLKLRYARTDQWHAVSIPYQGDRFEMVVMAAIDPARSGDVRRELGRKGFLKALSAFDFAVREVDLRLPRFHVEYGTDLTDVLSQLGLGPAFGSQANYHQMTSAAVRATSVLQRVVIDVTEEGTKAAAATAVVSTRSLETAEPVEFAADRPFVFAIVDGMTGAILFLGHVGDV